MGRSLYALSLATIAGTVLFCSACTPNGGAVGTTASISSLPDVVATIDGQPITSKDLEEQAAAQLGKVKAQIYEVHRMTLDGIIGDKLVEKAAKTAGKTPEEFIKLEVDDKVTPANDAEMKAFYEQRKAQMGGKKFEDIKGQIAQYLAGMKRQQAEQALGKKLRDGAQIKINLEPPRVKVEIGEGTPTRGPKDAKITIVEFTDYECPFCGRARGALKQVLDTYKDKVQYALRDFPLSFHQNAVKAHQAAYCAKEQDKFWDMNDKLFSNQQALGLDKLRGYAKELGLDTAKFDACLDSDKYIDKIRANQAAGAAAGVSGTPAFFINGIPLSGARPFSEFQKIIDAELAK